jgi:hypothetical protein
MYAVPRSRSATSSIAHVVAVLKKASSAGATRARRALCGLRGHDLWLLFEPDRLSLRCASCGWNSPGWTIGAPLRGCRVKPGAATFKRSSRPAPVREAA